MITTKEELERVAKAMNDAGYKGVTAEMVGKVANKWNYDVYVAIVGDAMVVYTPDWNHHNNGGFQIVCF